MKKTSKRVIAVVLTFAIVFSVVAVGAVALTSFFKSNQTIKADGSTIINANSVEEAVELMEASPEILGEEISGSVDSYDAKDNVIYPTIVIPGISQSISYLADENGDPAVNSNGTELSGGLLIIDDSKLIPTIANNLVSPLIESLVYQRPASDLADGVYDTVADLFAIQSSDKNGNPVNNLKTVKYETSVAGMSQDDRDYFYRMIPMESIKDDVGEDNLYLYAFPLIGDPMESARGLDEYIQFVKSEKGVDKVNIVTISLGGTILTAYLELFKDTGYPDLNRIVNVVACLDGTDVMGDFYLRNFDISDEFLFHEYIPMIMKETEGFSTLGHLINIALKIFPKQVVYTLLTAAIDGILDTLMLNCPQFWAMVPSDRFEEIKAKYNYIWTDDEYAVLADKIDAFAQARANLKTNLQAFVDADSANLVHNVAGYDLDYSAQDYCFFAIMNSSKTTNSDAIIDIDSTTLGARYAKAGEILADEILFDDNAIVSPDGSIDVSTCLFPENVWLFHGQHHEVGRNDVVISLIGKLITGEIKSTADMSDEYPQFNGNRNTKNIRRWYIEEAEEVLFAEDQSMYAEADLLELQDAYAEALLLLDTTICDPAVADATTDRLLNALRRVGVEGEAADETTDKILEEVCKFLDDTIFSVFGGGGFSDIADTGAFPNK
ncbi:MAG: hypothetical protein E7533_00085 [Ruminococcaceae bacterium]|nr:hypothetical protein [Oscillospiraceae bacterium]